MKNLISKYLRYSICWIVLITPNTVIAFEPVFSAKRGFYQSSFDVVVSGLASGDSIYYSLDGSDPRTSKTAIRRLAPVTVRIDPESSTGGRPTAPAVILRACIKRVDSVGISVTHTYLFVQKVKTLSPENVRPGTGWPNPTTNPNPQAIDYGMDPNILNDSRYRNLIDSALLAIPSISIATDLKHLFALDSGIYMNAMQDGRDWERPTSVELLRRDGIEGFQINAGIRIRGGWSRHGDNPKHAFRLFFRSEYGKAKLEYPLFENEGVAKFDKVDLRTGQNYAWSYPGRLGRYNTMISEVFSRDLQREMKRPYTRSRFYHLYINGVYWGLFQTQERSEARYAESYFGGNSDDYDVIKVGDYYSIEATDGNTDAYRELWDYCTIGFQTNDAYFKVQGLNPDGTRNLNFKNLVDIDNLIDYMLIIFYAGNFDCPSSKFRGDKEPNNIYCIYNRNRKDGFKFFIHDAEHTLRTTAGEGPGVGLYENRVNIGRFGIMDVASFSKFHPQWLHYKLSFNTEYRLRFADRAYKHLFNNGCMTPKKAIELFQSRAKEIDMAIIGESARWGNTYLNPAATKDNDWLPAINDIVKNYFPLRTNIVINQLRDENLYPTVNPPIFKSMNDTIFTDVLDVNAGFVLRIQRPSGSGKIYYTLDGTDPRAIGGSISASAIDGGSAVDVVINSTSLIKARILIGTFWSALHEIILCTPGGTQNLKVTEIHYHPFGTEFADHKAYEFLELKNTSTNPINLSQANFINGITYTFPFGTILEAGGFIVLASNRDEFNRRYGFYPFDVYAGQLDNSGERVTLCAVNGETIFTIRYYDTAPWPTTPNGGGYSLVPTEINPTGDQNDPSKWRASLDIHGSPGRDDIPLTSENSQANIPIENSLSQNYPNPFNPTTVISFQLSTTNNVQLKVYDVLGREVATLVNEIKPAGVYQINYNASHLAGGVYFYRLIAGNYSSVKKFILIK